MVTQAEIYTRLNDAKVQGYVEGFVEGFVEGLEKGLEKELLQGHSKAIITKVKRMLAKKMKFADIAEVSGLSIAEIKAL